LVGRLGQKVHAKLSSSLPLRPTETQQRKSGGASASQEKKRLQRTVREDNLQPHEDSQSTRTILRPGDVALRHLTWRGENIAVRQATRRQPSVARIVWPRVLRMTVRALNMRRPRIH
jgi:hypothetical protein